jgi:SAM-dependent methyltransferase
MIAQLKAVWRCQAFFPGLLGIFINPFYFARSGLRDAMVEFAPRLTGQLLDVGCGSKPYRSLFNVDAYVGLDIDSEGSRQRDVADQFYDGKVFPFPGNSFDSVLCNQVLEHVFNPIEFLAEIARVLKPGGVLLLTVPFVWDEHEQPFDYARYSSFGLRSLLEKQGFKLVCHKKLCADPSIIFQLANAYLFKVSQHLPKSINLLLTVTVMALVNLTGLLARALLPGNPDLFLDHAVLAKKVL